MNIFIRITHQFITIEPLIYMITVSLPRLPRRHLLPVLPGLAQQHSRCPVTPADHSSRAKGGGG